MDEEITRQASPQAGESQTALDAASELQPVIAPRAQSQQLSKPHVPCIRFRSPLPRISFKPPLPIIRDEEALTDWMKQFNSDKERRLERLHMEANFYVTLNGIVLTALGYFIHGIATAKNPTLLLNARELIIALPWFCCFANLLWLLTAARLRKSVDQRNQVLCEMEQEIMPIYMQVYNKFHRLNKMDNAVKILTINNLRRIAAYAPPGLFLIASIVLAFLVSDAVNLILEATPK